MQRILVSVRVDLIKMNICHRRRNHEKCCWSQERTAVVYVCKHYWALSFHTGFFLWCFRLWMIIGKAAQRIKMLLFSPKSSLSLNCYWLCRRDPSVSYLAWFSSFFFCLRWELLSYLQQQPTLKVSAAFSQPSPFLHTSPVSLPSYSLTSRTARKEHSIVAPWRENGRIHPTLRRW